MPLPVTRLGEMIEAAREGAEARRVGAELCRMKSPSSVPGTARRDFERDISELAVVAQLNASWGHEKSLRRSEGFAAGRFR